MANSFQHKSSFKFLIASFAVSVLAACGKGQLIPQGTSSTGTGAGGGTSGGGSTTRTTKRIFITSSTYNGGLGGASGADTKCMSDRPSGITGTYKALIADSSRSASPPSDWVLAASQQYTRMDDTTVIGTTTAARIFPSSLTNSITDTSGNAWTGLNSDWTTNASTCSDWTANTYLTVGTRNLQNTSTTSNAWSGFTVGYCDYVQHLICVEQ